MSAIIWIALAALAVFMINAASNNGIVDGINTPRNQSSMQDLVRQITSFVSQQAPVPIYILLALGIIALK